MARQVSGTTQMAVARLASQGVSQRDIASKLGVSVWTARKYAGLAEPKDYAPSIELVKTLPPVVTVMAQIEQLLRKRAKSGAPIGESDLADELNVSPRAIREAITELKAGGKNLVHTPRGIELSLAIEKADPKIIDISKFKGKKIRFGLTSDNHLASKYYRDDVLNALYDIWEEDGIKDVYQCGNMIDGDARFNKFDLLVHGMQAQADYFAEHWPARPGMHLHFITGDDHEGWYVQREGVNIGQFLESVAVRAGRKDMHYLGHMEHDIEFHAANGAARMRLIHGGGGSAYALSYTTQQIVNSYQGGEKPNILLVGHYHKAEYNYWREVHAIQAGCTEDQSPFMRKKSIQAHVGGWTVGFELDDNGIVHDFRMQFHPFYDRSFYKKWGYKY